MVALSAETKVELSTEGGSVNAIARKVSGGDYYYQKFTSDIPQANQVLIAPPGGTSGRGIEVAALVLDGTSELFVKKEALLAYSSRLNVEVIMKGLGMVNRFCVHEYF